MSLKTVVIVNDFNYVQGGASKIAIETAKILNDKGIKVVFFSAVNKEESNVEGIEYITTGQNEALKESNKIKGFLNGIYNIKAKRQFKQLLKKLDKETTIIHFHGWTKALSSSVFDVAFKMNFKTTLTLHDYFSICPNGGFYNFKNDKICKLNGMSWKCFKCNCDSRNYAFKLYRLIRLWVQNNIVKLNKRIKNVVSISKFSEDIIKNGIGSDINFTRIYNPIENKFFANTDNFSKNEYYLYVGRIAKEKGVDMFCQAITELGLNGIAVGDGDEKEKLKKMYPSIIFTGWKDSKDVHQYMKGAKALIFPSKWYETAGLTVLEAQALGIPCIVNKSCAASEFIQDGKSGLLFDSVKDLKEKIIHLDNMNIQIKGLDMFNQNTYYQNIMKLYKKILDWRKI